MRDMLAAFGIGALSALGLGALTSCDTTDSPRPQSSLSDDMPPYRYRGDNTVLVRFVDNPQDVCGAPTPDAVTFACTISYKDGRKEMVLRNPCERGVSQSFALEACHELGHVNGWSGKHEK